MIDEIAKLADQASAMNVRCYRRLSSSLKENLIPTIAIIAPQALNKLCTSGINSYGSLFKNIVYIVIARSKQVPDFMKAMAENKHIPSAASVFDEYYLESLLTGLIRERVQKKTALHGVVIETGGVGILIVGASSIGKTTAALEYVQKEGYWIADDLAVIRKNNKGELIARGHAKIRKYLRHGKEGIVPVEKKVPFGKIKKETKVSALIQLERTGINGNAISVTEKKILDTALHCLNMNISASGYFNKNLLEKSIKKLKKAIA